jgi:hypothetical protein
VREIGDVREVSSSAGRAVDEIVDEHLCWATVEPLPRRSCRSGTLEQGFVADWVVWKG